jgi:hypothetical protein
MVAAAAADSSAQTTVLVLAAGSVVMIAQFVVGTAGSRLVPHSEQGVSWDNE